MKASARSKQAEDFAVPTPRELFDRLSANVVGQDAAKKAVSVAAYNHFKRLALKSQSSVGSGRRGGASRSVPPRPKKSNVLLIGPTGSGKTHIARHLADALRVPFLIVDATEYTEAGYHGKDVESMISDLLAVADHSVTAAQQGIIFIDEVDKIARKNQSFKAAGGSTRDVGGEGVQQSLLKLLEGREVYISTEATSPWAKGEQIRIDTSDILFICAGTFSDLYDSMASPTRRKLGFNKTEPPPATGTTRRKITQEKLVEFGMLAEFLGRLPIVVELEGLGLRELKRIMTEPRESLVREYRDMLAADGVTLQFDDAAVEAIAEHALRAGLGARGLRSIMEDVMRDAMFEAPSMQGDTVHVTDTFVRARLT